MTRGDHNLQRNINNYCRPNSVQLFRSEVSITSNLVNQAGCERVFSDVGNTESPRRSRTGLEKLEKLTKVNAQVKADHLVEGVVQTPREKRKNHKSVEKLLSVPRYRDLLEGQDDVDVSERGRALVLAESGWRTEMAKWIYDARVAENEEAMEDADELIAAAAEIVKAATPTPRLPPVKVKKATKTTLAVLFGGTLKRPVTKLPPMEVDREAELMEALADAEEDERPDDGAIDCSEDEYEP
ncbi:hypothetical protein B0H13DRAFT_1854639 [Mycena leptocephala]|nr:hypothetical protein B0H13DRAFT_1854639 [Mycena leptocephala]